MSGDYGPAACAEHTRISADTPAYGPVDRCPDCGHLVIVHPLGGDGCELCRIEVRLQNLEEQSNHTPEIPDQEKG